MNFIQYLLHIDVYLTQFVSNYGALTYLALFLIIFCETGLVVTPFLPGDSLLFAAGSIAANPANHLSIQTLFVLLFLASVIGNKTNYFIGRALGPKVFNAKNSWFFNKKYLEDTHRFYEKHGGKTIFFARFIPIIRTFAPFVAGIGYMTISRFSIYNLISAFVWVGGLLGAGYLFGTTEFVKQNFTLIIYAIIAISLAPPAIGLIYKKTFASTP